MDVVQYVTTLNQEILKAQLAARFYSLPGFLSFAEGLALLSLAATWPIGGDVVEIGSFKGKSTCYLAAGCALGNRGRVFAVDHFGGSPEHQAGGWEETAEIVTTGSTYDVFRRNVAACGFEDRVEALMGNSTELSKSFAGRASLLFIDGEHSYEASKRDYLSWERFVPQFGLICFHDYQNNRYLDGVTQFIDDEILPSDRMKLISRVESLMVFAKTVS